VVFPAPEGDEITWIYTSSWGVLSNDEYKEYWTTRGVGSTAGEGIVGLMRAGTGGLLDSDNDGVSDVAERKAGTDPYTPNVEVKEENKKHLASAVDSWMLLDSDGDGVSDVKERNAGTNPFKKEGVTVKTGAVSETGKMQKILEDSKKQLKAILSMLGL